MIKLKELINESNVWDRKFGEPLPTLFDVMEKKEACCDNCTRGEVCCSVNEQEKKQSREITAKFDKAYLNFAREVRDVIKMVDRSTGDRTDGKIIAKAYTKYLLPLDKLMQSWNKTQQKNPHIDEASND